MEVAKVVYSAAQEPVMFADISYIVVVVIFGVVQKSYSIDHHGSCRQKVEKFMDRSSSRFAYGRPLKIRWWPLVGADQLEMAWFRRQSLYSRVRVNKQGEL